MPNRIIKESICRSDSIEELSWFEEVLFYRLMVTCDDYGRYDGRIAILKGSCFPLKDIRNSVIETALKKLAATGMVIVYEQDGKPFLQLTTWNEHQNIRAKKSKYPAFDNTCIQLYADACECSRNPIQSKSESKSESDSSYCSEQATEPQSPEPEQYVIDLELNTGEQHYVTVEDYDMWCGLYPAVDVMQCLRNMKGWIKANPQKRKTERGIKKFITTWLQKEQDKGGTRFMSSGHVSTSQYAESAGRWAASE